jgi:hypothetical protein
MKIQIINDVAACLLQAKKSTFVAELKSNYLRKSRIPLITSSHRQTHLTDHNVTCNTSADHPNFHGERDYIELVYRGTRVGTQAHPTRTSLGNTNYTSD